MNPVRANETFMNKDKYILKVVKKRKNIVYGAQSLKAQNALIRVTDDYDIYSKKPKQDAIILGKTLNKSCQCNNCYYIKPAYHKGTYKVKWVGADSIPNTKDDLQVADFTRPQRKIEYITIRGIRYAKVNESLKDKLRSSKNPKYAYRHQKDLEDIRAIKYRLKK